MQIVSNGDNLHEMSNPVVLKNMKNVINLSSAELVMRVVMLIAGLDKRMVSHFWYLVKK